MLGTLIFLFVFTEAGSREFKMAPLHPTDTFAEPNAHFRDFPSKILFSRNFHRFTTSFGTEGPEFYVGCSSGLYFKGRFFLRFRPE